MPVAASKPLHTDNVRNSAHDVLRLLFENSAMNQMEVARQLSITKAACNLHFQKLSLEQYIVPRRTTTERRGRPSALWELHADTNLFLGMAVVDGMVSADLIDFTGQLIDCCRYSLGDLKSRAVLLETVDRAIEQILATVAQRNGRINQCFVGIAGRLMKDGTVGNAANCPAMNGWNPDPYIMEKYRIPTYSDSLSMAYSLGVTQNCPPDSTVLTVDWGDGFGGIFSSNGRQLIWPVEKPTRYHGLWDFGHIRIVRDGRPCRCGKNGCLEAYVGGLALAEQHPELGARDAAGLCACAMRGDTACIAVLQEAMRLLVRQLYLPLELFGVDHIIFLGELSKVVELLMPDLLAMLAEFYPPEELAKINLRIDTHSKEKLYHGTALTARKCYFYPSEVCRDRGIGVFEIGNSF